MIFGYFVLAVALLIEIVGAYYSITGLAAIFSGAVIPILIMGGSLELGKVVAAVWLKNNWERASIQYKLYLLPAVAVLMLITSMGIFGFLSKAHNDQNLVSGDVVAKIAVYDEKIKTAKENIDANRKALKQMDEAVDQVMGRSTDEKGADKAVALRRAQQKERGRLFAEIETYQKTISSLNEARAPIAAEVRKVEAEVGPIKYIAAMIYGDNPDTNILEKAVTWVIVIIVAVFDPLALVLILAAQQSIRWARQEQDSQVQEETAPVEEIPPEDPPEPTFLEKHPYLTKPFAHFTNLVPMVFKPEKPAPASVEDPIACYKCGTDLVNAPGIGLFCPNKTCDIADDISNEVETVQTQELPLAEKNAIQLPFLSAMADNEIHQQITAGFGTEFPGGPAKGDMYLRVDYLPPRLFKWNKVKWVEIDRSSTDSYTYDEAYIPWLIEQLAEGKYDVDLLTDVEREQIETYLAKVNHHDQ